MTRFLVVTADDFGLCDGVNEGIRRAHLDGIVTATSLMVRRRAAAAAARIADKLPDLAVGLHLDLGEWTYSAGKWHAAGITVDAADECAVREEVDRQIGAFVRMVGRLPTHIDGHQHVHREPVVSTVVLEMAARIGAWVRDAQVPHIGGFHGQTGRGEPHAEWITPSALRTLLSDLGGGWHEVGCHPGIGVSPDDSSYATERGIELITLCDPTVRAAVDDLGFALRRPGRSETALRG